MPARRMVAARLSLRRPAARGCAALAIAGVLLLAGCGDKSDSHVYGAPQAEMGASQAVLGWNISVANMRFESDHVLIDVDAAPTDPNAAHAKPEDIRFGLYGALAHPIEATGLGSCKLLEETQDLSAPSIKPLAVATPERLTGTVCLGPARDQSQVRGVYVYSPRERIPDTVVAYPVAFPVGLPATTQAGDSGMELTSTSVEAWRANGEQLSQASLGEQTGFVGNGYMLLGLQIKALAEQYRDDSSKRGGPMMVLVAPSLPAPGLNPACSTYGASVLVLPDASMNSVLLNASLCTQGEINAALFDATVSVVGTRAAVWTMPRAEK